MRFQFLATTALLAALGGPAAASYEGGMAALERQDPAAAVREFRSSAGAGDAASQYQLGLLYYLGRGVEQDYSTAVDWLSQASRQNHYRAQYILAGLYATGLGVERDYDMARRLYRASAVGVTDATRLSALASADATDRLLESRARQQIETDRQGQSAR